MTITIYELLGLVKDGKAPKKIKYDGDIYEYDKMSDDYMIPGAYSNSGLLDNLFVFSQLNDTVEILEEENKIEKLNDKTRFYFKTSHSGNFRREDREELDRFIDKTYKQLDLLLDEINKLKEDK